MALPTYAVGSFINYDVFVLTHQNTLCIPKQTEAIIVVSCHDAKRTEIWIYHVPI